MGSKRDGEYNFEKMEETMPNLEFLSFKCPYCTDKEGNFSDIVFYIPKDDENKIATQCNCNGQEARCVVLLNLMHSYNNEKMLKSIINR